MTGLLPININDILLVIGISAFAGGTSFVGALLGKFVKFKDGHLLFLTAFGAGTLIAAAIFGMVVQSEKTLGVFLTLLLFVVGSIVFAIADLLAERKGGGAGILLGIGLDSIPESLAIGASVASGAVLAIGLLIGIQNVPEGIASFREMVSGRTAFANSKKALEAVGIISVIPIILGLIGLFFLQETGAITISALLAISAGGIFYMLFYDMIPRAHKDRKWLPTFGSVLGFIIGFAILGVLG